MVEYLARKWVAGRVAGRAALMVVSTAKSSVDPRAVRLGVLMAVKMVKSKRQCQLNISPNRNLLSVLKLY